VRSSAMSQPIKAVQAAHKTTLYMQGWICVQELVLRIRCAALRCGNHPEYRHAQCMKTNRLNLIACGSVIARSALQSVTSLCVPHRQVGQWHAAGPRGFSAALTMLRAASGGVQKKKGGKDAYKQGGHVGKCSVSLTRSPLRTRLSRRPSL
jgi:hypothetical protein